MVDNFENNHVNEKAAPKTSDQNVHADVKGDVTYDDKVIQKIIGVAIEQIDGLLTVDGGFFSNAKEKLVNTDDVTAGIETEVGKKQVAVDMDVVIEYGRDITDVAEKIRKVIRDEVAKMTHLDVIEVNIHVVDVKTKAEFEKDSETVQDKVTSAAKTTGEFASEQTDKAKDAVNRGTDKAQEKIENNQDTRVK
ncbi:Asp23/Gls24 family envelope stress response protein [Enterococcus hulanensis]|uniref:Stress response regulator gls24 homolog n=1 Tax=Enterococcus hulanensis TaxID=2559929 RepID=A0ABU3EUA2_9ENTE|nr:MULTISPECIES: Asp23/Gls24 family envelope stress response protein [Enterococcus]MBO0410471.1 Asp23/Gls24 family envelope stress response protein [Enterococcus hulanensis]MBX8939053.1 Asp23/Gls24 family envelope stress response protein [Enterococcus gilvus]MDT2598424.1 Asp23/Gls24 family envelope stress response protein [Enterococcus hulanensis]MDT2608071.1 Asp23/Gls24 family envelope stress response protein [Enterococcus hulanensis]MDT2615366.1 Asp23/Gls24 family envelope stress response pr